jgi:hypothetical protein
MRRERRMRTWSLKKFCQATDKICQVAFPDLTEKGCQLTAKIGMKIAS